MRINHRQSPRRQRLAGVTLIEALVAMAIFGVTFISLYGGMSMGFAVIGNARENLRATQVMVEKMETIRLYSWGQINTPGFIPATFVESYYPAGSGGGSGGETPGGQTSGGTTQTVAYYEGDSSESTTSSSSGGIVYSGKVVIGNWPGWQSYGGDMRRVVISVNWTSGGQTHNRSMITYVSRHGLQNYIY